MTQATSLCQLLTRIRWEKWWRYSKSRSTYTNILFNYQKRHRKWRWQEITDNPSEESVFIQLSFTWTAILPNDITRRNTVKSPTHSLPRKPVLLHSRKMHTKSIHFSELQWGRGMAVEALSCKWNLLKATERCSWSQTRLSKHEQAGSETVYSYASRTAQLYIPHISVFRREILSSNNL